MKNQALVSSKDKRKKLNLLSAAIFVWCLRVKVIYFFSILKRSVNGYIISGFNQSRLRVFSHNFIRLFYDNIILPKFFKISEKVAS